MRILVIESDSPTRFKLKTLLSAFGDCDSVHNGETAIRFFIHAHNEKAPYGLIATESRLPDMSTEQMIEKIRTWETEQVKLKPEAQVKILRTGASRTQDDLRILVVDDDYVSRAKLKSMLTPYGICDTAPDGALAMALFVASHEEGNPYGLISLDINMPGMRGPDVVKKIRDWEQDNGIVDPDSQVKILMITGTEDSNDMITSFSQGAQGYVQKPVIPTTLRISLENIGFISKRPD